MNVGDYVRTIKGKIYKLTENDLKFEMTKQNCKISSPNIIDLIEVGDYVNGMLVTNIWVDKESGNIEFEFNNHESYLYPKSWNYKSRVTKYKIKSIVTCEQFSQMEYKVGE